MRRWKDWRLVSSASNAHIGIAIGIAFGIAIGIAIGIAFGIARPVMHTPFKKEK